MEPRLPTSSPNPGFPVNALDYYDHCYALAMMYYPSEVERVRKLRFEDLTPDLFWSEYIWCVYASGFNAKILAKKFEALQSAHGNFRTPAPWVVIWERVREVFANTRKARAIFEVRIALHTAYRNEPDAFWWERWRQDHLATTQLIQKLPFMGPITCHHLARNIGLDTVKPDLHLVRLANHYQFDTPLRMCEYIAVNRPRPDGFVIPPADPDPERLGVVDLVLWYGASTWGTQAIKDAKLGDGR